MGGSRSKTTYTERTMLDRLNVRYGAQTTNGRWKGSKFLRAEHVPQGLVLRRDRICDFIATGMHSTPWGPMKRTDDGGWTHHEPRAEAPVFHGHEVKVSRADWLTELRDPSKAEAFRRHMHYWWLVAASKDIVRDDLPDGWGLMVPHGPRTLRVVFPAALNAEPEPMPNGLLGALMRATTTTETRLAVDAVQAP